MLNSSFPPKDFGNIWSTSKALTSFDTPQASHLVLALSNTCHLTELEIIPEDLALCEFACTSKQPVQEILQTGLDLVKKECA